MVHETDVRVPLHYEGYDTLDDALQGTPQTTAENNKDDDAEAGMPPFLQRTRSDRARTGTCVAQHGLQEHVRHSDGTLHFVADTEDVIYWSS